MEKKLSITTKFSIGNTTVPAKYYSSLKTMYGRTMEKLNEPVVFQLKSLDVVMGFSVPDFGVRGTIIPGQVTEVAMTPTKTGEFIFLCDVFCGTGHENMEGTMRVIA